MMDLFRRHAKGWITKILMGFLIFSFGIWGISDVFRRFADTDVVKVGSQRIDVQEFRELFRERLRVLGSQVGRTISNEQARMLGLDRQILSELVAENSFDENARALGLSISDADLIKRIHANPAFRNASGQFDAGRFEEALRSNGYTEPRYINVERRFALRQQIGRALGGDILAPDILGNAIRRYESEERSVQFVRLDRGSAGAVPAPTPEQVSEYFESRKNSFRAPEYRKLVILPLLPETLAASMEVSESDLRKAFDAQKERISVPERREVQQLLFPTAAEASAAAQKITGGASFEAIATERGLSAGDISLGTVIKRDISDPSIADAAFKLPEGKLSDPVQGRFGIALVRVNKIVPGKEANFTDFADALRKQLTTERARRSILDLHDKIEDERASGSNLNEVGQKTKLKAIAVEAVDRSGRAPDGKRIENVPGLDQVLAAAFTSEVGSETDPVEIRPQGGYVWFEVAGITPSRDRPLDEVRQQATDRWRDDELARRLEERTETMKKRLDAGDKFEAVAQGLKIETRDKLVRDRPVDGIDNALLSGIFETPQGKAGIIVNDDRIGRVLFRVTGVNVPAAVAQASPRTAALGTNLQDDLLVQYVMRLQEQIGVTINDANFRNATGATGN